MRHLFISFSVCVSLLQAKTTNLPLMATTNHHPLNVTTLTTQATTRNKPTTNHRINQPTPTKERFHQREIENLQPQHPATHGLNTRHNPQPTTESTQTHKSTQHPQINPHHEINLASTNQPTPTTSKPRSTQPHPKRLVSNMALAMEATFREHIHDTFDEVLGKTTMAAPSSSSRRSSLLKWISRVKKRQRGIKKEKERGKQWREALHKRE